MAPLRGWAPRGMRLTAKVPHGHWKTTTFLAALRHDRIDAPWVLDGPINGESFRIYVEKILVPSLKPGDIVIMDNLGSHKGKTLACFGFSIASRVRWIQTPIPILAMGIFLCRSKRPLTEKDLNQRDGAEKLVVNWPGISTPIGTLSF
jgi:hypothetical protein